MNQRYIGTCRQSALLSEKFSCRIADALGKATDAHASPRHPGRGGRAERISVRGAQSQPKKASPNDQESTDQDQTMESSPSHLNTQSGTLTTETDRQESSTADVKPENSHGDAENLSGLRRRKTAPGSDQQEQAERPGQNDETTRRQTQLEKHLRPENHEKGMQLKSLNKMLILSNADCVIDNLKAGPPPPPRLFYKLVIFGRSSLFFLLFPSSWK